MKLPTGTPLRAATATVAAACALLLASCSSEAGQPQSQDAETSSTPLANLEPCSSLTGQQKKQLNVTELGKTNEYKEGTCDWEIEGNKFGISIYKDKALTEVRFSDASNKEQTKISGHESLLAKYDDGSCSLAFAVTENSSVSVNSTADTPGDTQAACELVKKAAPMVEQNIPES